VSRSREQNRRIRKSTIVLAAVVLAIYFGYIALKLYRHFH